MRKGQRSISWRELFPASVASVAPNGTPHISIDAHRHVPFPSPLSISITTARPSLSLFRFLFTTSRSNSCSQMASSFLLPPPSPRLTSFSSSFLIYIRLRYSLNSWRVCVVLLSRRQKKSIGEKGDDKGKKLVNFTIVENTKRGKSI